MNIFKFEKKKKGILGFEFPEEIYNLLYVKKEIKTRKIFKFPFISPEQIDLKLGVKTEQGMIDTNLEIEKHSEDYSKLKIYCIEYAKLSPKERYSYLKWLETPYNKENVSISFVFLFLTVLERRIYTNDKRKEAYIVLKKLFYIYCFEKSFSQYAFYTLAYYGFINNEFDVIKDIVKNYNYIGNSPIGIFCKFIFKIPLYAKDLMDISNSVKFKNKNYIKKFPEMFEKILNKLIVQKFKNSFINITDIIILKNGKNLATDDLYDVVKDKLNSRFLISNFNLSLDLNDEKIRYYNFFEDKIFTENIYNLLLEAHQELKLTLKEERKKPL